jgi:hypothetical protein
LFVGQNLSLNLKPSLKPKLSQRLNSSRMIRYHWVPLRKLLRMIVYL